MLYAITLLTMLSVIECKSVTFSNVERKKNKQNKKQKIKQTNKKKTKQNKNTDTKTFVKGCTCISKPV